jgi:hypothetical protein
MLIDMNDFIIAGNVMIGLFILVIYVAWSSTLLADELDWDLMGIMLIKFILFLILLMYLLGGIYLPFIIFISIDIIGTTYLFIKKMIE